jgi:hypothetical protein
VLRALAGDGDADFGVYADVVIPGRIRRHDRLVVVD